MDRRKTQFISQKDWMQLVLKSLLLQGDSMLSEDERYPHETRQFPETPGDRDIERRGGCGD